MSDLARLNGWSPLWPRVLLGDVGEIASGITLGQRAHAVGGREVPYLRVANVKDGYFDLSDVYTIRATEDEIQELKLYPGDLLLTEGGDRDKLGRGTFWNDELPECIHQNHIFRVRLNPEQFDPAFVAFMLRSEYGKHYFLHHAKQTTGIATINRQVLARFPVLMPELEEQRRIAAGLTAALAVVDKARRASAERVAATAALPAAYLREVFEGAEAEHWPRVRIADFAKTCSGATPSRGNRAYFGGNVPWVKTGELRDSLICDGSTTDESVTELALRECSLPLLPADTLLVAMYGQGQTRGRTGILARPATTNQACFAILPDPERFDPRYLQMWFRVNYESLRALTENRGGNQPNLNGVLLRRLEVPLPPLADQCRIAAGLAERLAAVEALAERAREELAAVEALPAALLRQAFGGAGSAPGG